ncbi:MAG: permease [Victivallaceae bacterium]|nr:permease [Victivallaceae bacterium]
MTIWNFIQNQLLGMEWLNQLTGMLLTRMGVDLTSKGGNSIQFFLYDTIKITILLCVLIYIISFIQSYFPPERSRAILGRYRGIWANMLAALLGTVTPFCSCSSIPLFIGFTRAGLPLGVTFSFLISSPMVDLGSLVLLTSIFGAKVAVAYVGIGLVLAILGGTLIEKLHMERFVEDFVRQAKTAATGAESENLTRKERFVYAREQTWYTFRKVFAYILIGVGIGAFIHNWIPSAWVEAILGGKNPMGVIVAVLAGTPMYADIFGTIPVAQALLGKGAQLGTVLAFMMAVTTLSLPSMLMLRKAVKPRLLALFFGICVGGIILIGYLFNALQNFLI